MRHNFLRRPAILSAIGVVLAAGAITVHLASAEDNSRTITLSIAPDPSPAPNYTATRLEVVVSSTSGQDYGIETSVSAPGVGFIVEDAAVEAYDALEADDVQKVGIDITQFGSGTVFTVTSKFRDANGTLLDTRQATLMKP